MSRSRRVVHFLTELEKLIDRFRAEYDLTYAEAVGCLEIVQQALIVEMRETHDEDEESDSEDDQG